MFAVLVCFVVYVGIGVAVSSFLLYLYDIEIWPWQRTYDVASTCVKAGIFWPVAAPFLLSGCLVEYLTDRRRKKQHKK